MSIALLSVLFVAPHAVIAYNPAQRAPSALDKAVAAAVRRAGYSVELVSSGELIEVPKRARLLVFTDARNLPARLAKPVDRFLKNHGRLLALRSPAWQNPLFLVDGKWVDQKTYGLIQASRQPDRLMLDLKRGPLQGWERSSNDLSSPASYEAALSGLPNGSMAVHARIANLTSWDTVISPPLEVPFAKGMEVTQFAAKGGNRSTQMVVEWREKDGSRWIAAVPLGKTWRLYRLGPEAFRYWQSNPNRGYPGDKFNPANAERVSLGIAYSHNGEQPGAHEFWVANLGASFAKPGEPADAMSLEVSPTDGLYPHYKFFKTTVPVRVVDAATGAELQSRCQAFSLQPRPQAHGFDKRRDWTFETLLEARDDQGEWRGIPAALIRWGGGDRKGAGIASYAVTDAEFYRRPATLKHIEAVARRLDEDVWLVDAGSDRYTQFKDGTVRVGATVYADKDAACRVAVIQSGQVLCSGNLALRAGETEVLSSDPCVARQGRYRTELRVKGKLVEAKEQDQHVYEPSSQKSFVAIRDGRFVLKGEPIRFNGVNYMPSSGIGVEDHEYFEYWMDRKSYDPDIVSRDLWKIKSLGLNAVSVFIYERSVEAGNLLDFIRQCRELGLKINLSLRPGTPMDFNWSGVQRIVSSYRLKDEDAVFAYDLAWEPNMGNHAARKKYDGHWANWATSVYGSFEAAVERWGYPTPIEDGKPTNPPDRLLVTDGPWRRMVSDYRRFVNDLLYVFYSEARSKVKSIDPNHLVSFRMAEAGNPTFNWDGFMPYELAGIAHATDFLAPEAYGRIGDWEQVKPGQFAVAYCRSLPPGNPVIWAEAGMSSLDSSRLEPDARLVLRQGDLYRDIYRILIESQSDGVFWWWYPGGVRVGEKSDYGIVNPDGTDRPSTGAIREFGPKFLAWKPVQKPERLLEYSMGDDARGLYGVYQKLKDEFWRWTDAGYTVKLRNRDRAYETDPAGNPGKLAEIYRRLGLSPPEP